ncbi:unnamed protein product [Linum tenue]|uniref:C2H2-type domain-containing protein n=1 Tax=Linum tenue TaxID=586396 RepID=A0AAV0N2V8_9ROSI|nr:unnamed protein product [Linum tenue]
MLIRGKRAKRHRSASPPPPPLKSSTSSSAAAATSSGESQRSATSSGYESSTEEEEDMANCLILLAQGRRRHIMGSRKFSDIATTTNRAGFFVYECKTCNRTFPSFQALGGHRASHKKPRPTPGPPGIEDKKVISAGPIPACQVEMSNSAAVVAASATNSGKAATPAGNKAAKVHECAICGAEFTSGQALGGHMRRHRATNAGNQTATADLNNQQKNHVLSLDLNLPAPEDLDAHQHHRAEKQSTKAMMFSAPALVGCHY